jgi:hypothetical protein
MRTIDLALIADIVAARGAAVEARLERARDRIRQAAIEREARRALPQETVERLEESGVLTAADIRAERREVGQLAASLGAIRHLQAWAEAKLAEAQADAGFDPDRPAEGESEPYGPTRAA